MEFIFLLVPVAIIGILIVLIITEKKYKELENEVLKQLGFTNWDVAPYFDESITVSSRKALEKYDDIKFFKENPKKLAKAASIIKRKAKIRSSLKAFLQSNAYQGHPQYGRLVKIINEVINNVRAYRIRVTYISSAGNNLGEKVITLTQASIDKFEKDPTLLMSKGEYSSYLKGLQKEELTRKSHEFYNRVNSIIELANDCKSALVIKGSHEELDRLISQLFDRTINSIKKIKAIDSDEWNVIENFITQIEKDIKQIISKNKEILDYYESEDFLKIKEACETLMGTQRDFNEYIAEKVVSISSLFGTRVVRNETINEDEYQYIRHYKKTVTPFTAEVSATVFASAENSPIEYIIKYFYPDKSIYPEQIQKLHLLVGELATLRDARCIIDNYKEAYQQYLSDVPDYIMKFDEAGFYSRLGFANIDESVLVVEYKFSYTSGGGMAQRSFTVPMTEETILDLIKSLESKLTVRAFTKEQRALMTAKLREHIKTRDGFTCCCCGNSINKEPNLLLEIDHIIPVSKGGCTVEENLQTLCWKCNRTKSNKIVE